MANPPYLYRGYVETLSQRFDAALSYIQTIYNFDYGDEFEIAICQVLRGVLPQRFGICRGHVVNSAGEEAGDDIIIYDRFLFPTLRLLPQEDYSRKEWIPIEAVFAYIEAKHTLNLEGTDGSSLSKACQQVGNVRRLCSQRPAVPINQAARHVVFTGEAKLHYPANLPQFRNPFYGMIISRNLRQKAGEGNLTDPRDIFARLNGIKFENPNYADAFILGRSNIILSGKTSEGGGVELRLFLWGADCALIPLVTVDVAFGVGLCVLLTVLDTIQLGVLPWREILEDALNPKRHYPEIFAPQEQPTGDVSATGDVLS